MNLLPKAHEEFSSAEYWNTFFKKRGKKSFDWYGEYPELCEILSKYMKIKDDVLIVGCGNSTLSMSLYDVGYRNITNIDISHVVIKQMKDINMTTRPDLVYEQMDATQMSYPDGKFSVVLDKGTLDALMPDTKDTTISTVDKYFKEIARVLRNGGRYICISLLQEHILRKLLSYFPSSEFMCRTTRCHEVEAMTRLEEGSLIPVFASIATKFTRLPQTILEIALVDGPPERLSSIEAMVSAVQSIQQSALVSNSLQKRSVSDVGEICLDLYRLSDEHPRYVVYVLDQPKPRGAKTYAAFIVPQGKETDWLFNTKEGRQQILNTAKRDRLAIVTLRREHKFENWDSVKSELEECIRNLAPDGLSDKNAIPFLSMGHDLGIRKIIYEGTNETSGPFVIEEVTKERQEEFRRLIFLNNPYVIQSEAKLKLAKSRRGKTKKVIDPGFLACEHHMFMSVGVNAAIDAKEPDDIMIVGLGGGGLCTFLYHCFPKLRITAVDIDEAMLKIATEHFGLPVDGRMKVEIADGVKFIKDAAANGVKYRAILFDVDNKDITLGLSCPPKQFLETSTLTSVADCLVANGLFILNLVGRDKVLKQRAKDDLKSVFRSIIGNPVPGEVNEIIVCSVLERDPDEWKNELKAAGNSLNEQAVARKLFSADDVSVSSTLLETLAIES